MLHTVTTGLCTVVPVPVGSCVGTWIVSFVCWDDGFRSPSLCRNPRDPSARGFAAVPGPDDRPVLRTCRDALLALTVLDALLWRQAAAAAVLSPST